MIKVNGADVEYSGSLVMICAEVTAALRTLYEIVREDCDEDFARATIERCKYLSLLSDKELRERATQKMKENGLPEDFLSKVGDTHVN